MAAAPIYLDHQATTPCDPAVVQAMAPWWSDAFANPSSRSHRPGLEAAAQLTLARERLAQCLAVPAEAVVFTSGATEANNLALLGHARARRRSGDRPGHLISVVTEHHAVLDPLRQLQREGFQLTLLQPEPDGLINPARLKDAITADTVMVSVMAANNEIGVLQPLAELSEICRHQGITMHSDAAQAFGHIPLDPDALGLDLVSLSAHKLYGPKGIGALVIRGGIELTPLQWGGGQEQGLRPGTLPVPLIVGFAAAAKLNIADRDARSARLQLLRDHLFRGLQEQLPQILLNGAEAPRLPHNLNISVPGVNGNRLHRALRPELTCSSGSACSNGSPSHVLQALGRSRQLAEASLRLSLGRSTTEQDVEQAIRVITKAVHALTP